MISTLSPLWRSWSSTPPIPSRSNKLSTTLGSSFSSPTRPHTVIFFRRLVVLCTIFGLVSRLHSAEPTDHATGATEPTDVVVVGGTPGGLATAIRAAREGLSVVVINHTQNIGGMLTNGLGVLDTYYHRARSPIYDEMTARIVSHYEGVPFDPQDFARPDVGERLYYEPHVIEQILNEMVAREDITVMLGYYPTRVTKADGAITSVEIKAMQGTDTTAIAGRYFVDATYEADLAALAGVPYRVGREARDEFNEPHAGVTFSILTTVEERPDVIKDLRVDYHHVTTREIPHPRNGEGDDAIQAFNFRLALSRDPDNRYLPPRPADYDPSAYQIIKERLNLPGRGRFNENTKHIGWNAPILPGGNHDYPEASWEQRQAFAQTHLDWAIGILHYLQADDPEPVWGLAKDEFTDNGYVPYEMYVRETRRIQGPKIFTEHDGLLSPHFSRAPIHAGAIAITEWTLDSHACTADRHGESRPEGKVLLSETTVPGQVDWQCLISPAATNLVVPVCLSSTHIGWGTIRLEPTWMHIGESTGFALRQARDQQSNLVELDVGALQRTLAAERILLTYFDDVELMQGDAWVPAVQFLGTKGFFDTYRARANDPLDETTAEIWLEALGAIHRDGSTDPNETARALSEREVGGKQATIDHILQHAAKHYPEIVRDLKVTRPDPTDSRSLSRGTCSQWFYAALNSSYD